MVETLVAPPAASPEQPPQQGPARKDKGLFGRAVQTVKTAFGRLPANATAEQILAKVDARDKVAKNATRVAVITGAVGAAAVILADLGSQGPAVPGEVPPAGTVHVPNLP